MAKLADFQRHAVHKIIIFGRRQHRNHALAELFNLEHKLPSVEDRAVYLPGQWHRQLHEQVAFRVNACAFARTKPRRSIVCRKVWANGFG